MKLRRSPLKELSEDYITLAHELREAQQEASAAWREVGRLGERIALYDARVKTRVSVDTRVRTAEARAEVLENRQTASDIFWTSVLNGEYDDGLIPVPTEQPGEYEEDDLTEECE